jgi:hypothetical protein
MASAPASTTRRASSTVWIPLMISGPRQKDRNQSRSATVIDGSNSLSANSPRVPSEDVRDAKVNGLVVNKFSHHIGWVAVSRIVRTVSARGSENPARSSRRRRRAIELDRFDP